MPMLTRLFAAFCVLTAAFAFQAAETAHADAGFKKWVRDFYGVARKNGISRKTYNRAFKGVTAPDMEVIQLTRFQPEFKQQLWMYFDSRVNEDSVAEGQVMERKWSNWLSRIERTYGVDRYTLLAIWSMETTYGEALTQPKTLRNVIRSLSTLAYADRRRRKFARSQLIAALKMLQQGQVTPQNLTGSWAGAMGHTQFIPTSYRLYRQDIDADGRADIWNSVPDALATAANLLKRNGWRKGQTWGYEVDVPRTAARHAGKTKTIQQWANLGVRRVLGRKFTNGGLRAVLKFPAGKRGPAFLMLRNFYVLKKYNNADKYALAVGHLADRIAGSGEFANPVPRPHKRLSKDQRMQLQRVLARMGLYDGKIDGKIGSGSRAAIRKAQDRLGLTPDGYESIKLLNRLQNQG